MFKKKENYRIQVGPKRPEKMLSGNLDKKSGTPSGETIEVGVLVGVYLLVNYAVAWGRRIARDAKGAEMPKVSVTDKEYKGELEFLPWGDPDGYSIELRYLKNSPSTLDLQYQKKVLELVPGLDDGNISLSHGENVFDPATDEMLIEFLKVHGQNEDNKSKSPNIIGSEFYEVTEKKESKAFAKSFEKRLSAGQFISQFSVKPESLRLIAGVLKGDSEELAQIDENSTDIKVYDALIRFAEADPEKLLTGVATFKKVVNEVFLKALSFSKLDLSGDRVMVIYEGEKKDVLLNKIPEKGDAMIGYVVENIFKPEFFDAYLRVDKACKEL